ncbi:BnaUnng01800D [Brassica napus]|uniref:BnaUnng01800D protein n=1 Tax=Brassica napus TaxID=3708 RepID=A0A078JHC3_BRANA|nr:BnaUnng01800D [Brassica napus]
MGIENLKTPWVPNFKGIPAKMTDSAVEAKEAIHRKIWHRSLNYVVNDICKSVVPVWKRVNRIANSIKRDRSKSKGWPQSGIDRGCLVEAPVGSHSLLREPYLSTVFLRNSTERVDPLLPFVLATYPKVSSPFSRVTKVPRQELSGDDRGTNPLAVAGRLFLFHNKTWTIIPNLGSLRVYVHPWSAVT